MDKIGKPALYLRILFFVVCFWPVMLRAAESGSLADLVKKAKTEGEVNISGSSTPWGGEDSFKAVEKAFIQKYGPVPRLRLSPGPSMQEGAERIIQESKGGVKTYTDLFVGTEDVVPRLAAVGELLVFPWRRLLPDIPVGSIQLNGTVLEFTSKVPGFSYNTNLVAKADIPRRLQDLLNPRWKGRIASTPYAANWDRVAELFGYEEAKSFLRRFTETIGGLIRCGGEEQRIASGEFLMLALNCGEPGPWLIKSRGGPVEHALLEDAVTISHDYLAVPKNSAHPNAAALLAGFMLSNEAQQILYDFSRISSHHVKGMLRSRELEDLKSRYRVVDINAEYWAPRENTFAKIRKEFQDILAGKRL